MAVDARRRRRAATRPGRRAAAAPGAASSAEPLRRAARPRPARPARASPRKPDGSDCSRASIQPATSPWSWLPAEHEQLALGPERRARLARGTAPASVGRVAVRRLAQLEPVAEHDEPVDAAQRLDQRRAQLGPPQQVLAARGAEVQVGDDERAHPTSVPRTDGPARRHPRRGLLARARRPARAMLLGDLGADVVKVERPDGGDDTRAWGPPWRDGEATYYLGLNRNKRSLALDLGDAGGRRARAPARRARRRADRVVPPRADGALGPRRRDAARRATRGLVTCSVTAFGTAATRRARLPGYDFLAQAMGGLMSVTGEEDGRAAEDRRRGRRPRLRAARGRSASRPRWPSASGPAAAATSRSR